MRLSLSTEKYPTGTGSAVLFTTVDVVSTKIAMERKSELYGASQVI